MLGQAGLRQLAALLAAVALGFAGCSDQTAHSGTGGQLATARVTKHTDGDTLWLSDIGKVRLIGIDTPEVYGQTECYGREASAFMARTVPLGSELRYRLGVDERDRYGRALAYLWLPDGRFLNRLLVARGYAQPMTVPPNVEYADLFVRMARRARAAGRGLWGRPGCSG
ncbi:MAG TPA: thermonuclease family protein [Thermoleophilaceae bacterium]|nr:thermonuclease family protein [Thermoleophilaceae bacterium]